MGEEAAYLIGRNRVRGMGQRVREENSLNRELGVEAGAREEGRFGGNFSLPRCASRFSRNFRRIYHEAEYT